MEKIDFVLLWVDGGDEAWLKQKNEYSPVKKDYSAKDNRFRDWDNLQYWFRAVEMYAPWVNNIYFITWGHLPKWLNTDHPKLKVIKHTDFIPADYLPTFNSDTIELNLWRIPDLSENFVLFNDDVILLRPTKPDDFFRNGLPRDEMILNAIQPKGEKFRISNTILNNMNIINTHFKKNAVIKKNPLKLFHPCYGSWLLRTLLLMPWGDFLGFRNPHSACSHLKSTFVRLWELEGEKMHASCLNRFRGLNDLSHWLMRYWNMCEGRFVPRSPKFTRYYNLSANNEAIYRCIRKQQTGVICVNDMSEDIDVDTIKTEWREALDTHLFDKSNFEL